MERLRRLNHRYALDGSDPNSWAGLWWCLGLFDRPFQPEQPVFGALRTRPLAAHQRRLEVDRYAARCRPAAGARRIAVVGAGLAGALAGCILADHGHRVTLYDKGRGAGGRMSSRRQPHGRVDYGGRRFRLDCPELAPLRQLWLSDGVIRPLGQDQYAPVGPANALVRHLLADTDARFGQRVTGLRRDGPGWRLHDLTGELLGEAEIVLLALPPAQAAELIESFDPALASCLQQLPMTPAWVVMAALPAAVPCPALPTDTAELAAVELQRSEGGQASILLEATPAWSVANLEASAESIARSLWQCLQREVAGLPQPDQLVAHRWRYARPSGRPFGTRFDIDSSIGLAGDWCEGNDAEAALRSGQALAGRVLAALAQEVGA
jgi:predicted NAD/FAD-dependent oxidoreductase